MCFIAPIVWLVLEAAIGGAAQHPGVTTMPAVYDPAVTQRQIDGLALSRTLDGAERVRQRSAILQGLGREEFLAYAKYAIAKVPSASQGGPVEWMYADALMRDYAKVAGANLATTELFAEVKDRTLPSAWRMLQAAILARRDLPLRDLQDLAAAMLDMAANEPREREEMVIELIWRTEGVLQEIQARIAPGSPVAANEGHAATTVPVDPASVAPERVKDLEQLRRWREGLLRVAQGLSDPGREEIAGRIDWMRAALRGGPTTLDSTRTDK